MDQVDDAVIITEADPLANPGPRIVYCNRASVRLTGILPEELLGQPLTVIFDGLKAPSLLARLKTVAETGKTYQILGDLVRGGGQEPLYCRWKVSGLSAADGEPLNFTFSFREWEAVPDEKAAGSPSADEPGEAAAGVGSAGVEDEMAEIDAADAAIAEQSKMESLAFIASGIAHDFNNVLTPIIANLSLAKLDAEPGSALRSRIDEAKRAADEARGLARQILDFARCEKVHRKEVADVGRLIRKAASMATLGASVRCDLSLSDDLWAAEIDPTQISQVVSNLLINAIQAMPDGGIVQASVENVRLGEDGGARVPGVDPGRYLEITVRDRGCGIPEDNLENIFLTFFTTKETGSGIGLAMCRAIVRDHGGEITVKSKVQSGTEFRVYLPACDRPAEGGDAADGERVIEGEGTVLVVDDQNSIRTVATAIIKKLGYDALSARDGEEALQIYRDRRREGRPISVVLLDMTLPGGMSGMDTLGELLKIDGNVRTIASSGYFDDEALAAHKERGYVGILPKPYTVERLSKAVHDALLAEVV
ncbi:hypothetical protein BH23VER1_BH23VER1_37000 [soil metagenome]